MINQLHLESHLVCLFLDSQPFIAVIRKNRIIFLCSLHVSRKSKVYPFWVASPCGYWGVTGKVRFSWDFLCGLVRLFKITPKLKDVIMTVKMKIVKVVFMGSLVSLQASFLRFVFSLKESFHRSCFVRLTNQRTRRVSMLFRWFKMMFLTWLQHWV